MAKDYGVPQGLNPTQALFEWIRVKGQDVFGDTVPPVTAKTPISSVWTPILEQPDVMYPEFTRLLGAWMFDDINNKEWTHPLLNDIIKNGNNNPLGAYVRGIGANPQSPMEFDPLHPERVLDYKLTTDFVVYYCRNIKKLFKISIPLTEAQEWFTSWDKAGDYIQMKRNQLVNGLRKYQFEAIKQMIVSNAEAGCLPIRHIGYTIGQGTTTDFENIATEFHNLTDAFPYYSTEYCGYNKLSNREDDYQAFTRPEDIRFIGRNDFFNEQTVKFLASTYHYSLAEIKQKIHKIDNFDFPIYDDFGKKLGNKISNIACVVCDINALKCRTDFEKDGQTYNEETLIQNLFKHYWATFYIDMLANCVVYLDGEADSDEINLDVAFADGIVKYGSPALAIINNTTGVSNGINVAQKTDVQLIGANGVLTVTKPATTDFTVQASGYYIPNNANAYVWSMLQKILGDIKYRTSNDSSPTNTSRVNAVQSAVSGVNASQLSAIGTSSVEVDTVDNGYRAYYLERSTSRDYTTMIAGDLSFVDATPTGAQSAYTITFDLESQAYNDALALLGDAPYLQFAIKSTVTDATLGYFYVGLFK